MNYKVYFKSLTILALSVMMTNSCVKSDDFSVPPIVCQDKFGPTNHALTDIKTLAKEAPTEADIITEDYIVEGYVSSTDESGNIYKMLFIQDQPENPTFAIEMDINGSNQHVDFPVGAKVKINLKGLIVQEENGNYKIGSYDPSYPVGRIEPDILGRYLARTCGADGKPVLATMVPEEFSSIAEASDVDNVNKLVKITGVQFVDEALPKTFSDENKTGDRYIMDKKGGKLDLRFSNYADFSTQNISPDYEGSGSITFILSRYRTTYQGYIRTLDDLGLDQARFAVKNINFEQYDENSTDLSPNFNIAVVGNELWQVREYNNNKYIQLSAFNNGDVKTHLAIPFKFNGQNKLSFETNSSYYNGDVFKVYWSTDYDPNNPSAATLHDITSHFDISKSSNYEDHYRPSGEYALPADANGEGFVIFEYVGSSNGGATTTMQIDNISIL